MRKMKGNLLHLTKEESERRARRRKRGRGNVVYLWTGLEAYTELCQTREGDYGTLLETGKGRRPVRAKRTAAREERSTRETKVKMYI